MNEKVLIIIILLLLFLTRKSKTTGTNVDPLVTSYVAPDGIYFAVQINDIWHTVNASSSEIKMVSGYTLKTEPAPNGNFKLTVSNSGGGVSEYYANSQGETI